ncbi:hypothetical protein [Micromonospora sp. MW-13]|uniref:hypothetical protein n=1 Tax=Micromonospora sp. MW-13 TaxID=2094022 RepID=UPI000E44ED54|nr:hypothetical protein [Micromonospora sp. MW-13]
MSRQELADAVNAHAYSYARHRTAVDARYIGRLERGEHRWPFEPYRTALREVLGKATDADLGFFIIQGHARDPGVSPEEPGPEGGTPSTVSGDDRSRTAAAAKAAAPGITARAATVRVRVNVNAEDVTVVRRDGTTGAVAVLAGFVEVLIAPSDVALDSLAAVLGGPPAVAGLCQVHWLPDRRRSR